MTTQGRPLLPSILAHIAVAVACFAFITAAQIAVVVGGVLLDAATHQPTAYADDEWGGSGGPFFWAFFPMFALAFAAASTVALGAASLLSDVLRRRVRAPRWLPPSVVLVGATSLWWALFTLVRESGGELHWAVVPIGGAAITLAFIVHWAAVSSVLWFSSRPRATLSDAHRPFLTPEVRHMTAAVGCFVFTTVTLIAADFVAPPHWRLNPMFDAVWLVFALALAAAITIFIAAASLLSDRICRKYRAPRWLPALVVLVLVSAPCAVAPFALELTPSPWLAPIAVGTVTLAFIVYWAATSSVLFSRSRPRSLGER
jgi:hypothetical protein